MAGHVANQYGEIMILLLNMLFALFQRVNRLYAKFIGI